MSWEECRRGKSAWYTGDGGREEGGSQQMVCWREGVSLGELEERREVKIFSQPTCFPAGALTTPCERGYHLWPREASPFTLPLSHSGPTANNHPLVLPKHVPAGVPFHTTLCMDHCHFSWVNKKMSEGILLIPFCFSSTQLLKPLRHQSNLIILFSEYFNSHMLSS